MSKLFGSNLNLTGLDLGAHLGGRDALNSAAHGGAGAEDLTNSPRKILGQRSVTNLTGNLDNLIKGQVSVVLDVLLLFAVTGGLLQGLDNVAGGARLDLKSGNTVGDGQLDTDTQTLVVLGLLGNVFLDLLGGLE